jgi:uncharacterized protein (TIGR00255 family)
MTGYGAAECVDEGVSYTLSIRSVNNRFLKITIKMPESLQFLEPEVEKLLRSRIARGSVVYSLHVRTADDNGVGGFSVALLQDYVNRMAKVKMPPGIQGTIDLAGLAQLLALADPVDLDDEAIERNRRLVTDLTNRAVDALVAMRREEGQSLSRELRELCDSIRDRLGGIRERAPAVVEEYHQRLRSRVQMLMNASKLELEADALAREVAIYAERCDVNEELSRLTSHLDQFASICDRGDQAGRTLEFVTQELLREANTIGSKSNDAAIARDVVEIKGRIDRLKEQVQNVE